MTNNINNRLYSYLNNKMTDSERSLFEQEMSGNEFLADAVEGFKITGALPEDLDIIKSDIIAEKKTKLRTYLLWTGIAASITIIFVYFFLTQNQPLNKSGHSLSKSFFDLNINYDQIIDNDSLIISPNHNKIQKTYISELKLVPEKVIVPESIPPLHINKNIEFEHTTNNNSIVHSYAFKSNHYYTYIENYKIVDYRYDNRVNPKAIEIPSNFNFLELSTNNLPENKSCYTYNDFLTEALVNIGHKNYSTAIEYFDIILSQYPNDVNACYYKALCLFETNQNQKSLEYLELTLSNRINTFHEESKWYKSLIFKEEKQYAATEKVLLEIINDNGYYGVQARKELDELYKYYLNE